jgi:hypothetical protein
VGRAGDTDNCEPRTDDQAKDGVQDQLRCEELAQSTRGVVQGGRGPFNVSAARKADEPITQILSLKEKECHKNQDNPACSEWIDQRLENCDESFGCAGRWLMDFDGDWPGG